MSCAKAPFHLQQFYPQCCSTCRRIEALLLSQRRGNSLQTHFKNGFLLVALFYLQYFLHFSPFAFFSAVDYLQCSLGIYHLWQRVQWTAETGGCLKKHLDISEKRVSFIKPWADLLSMWTHCWASQWSEKTPALLLRLLSHFVIVCDGVFPHHTEFTEKWLCATTNKFMTWCFGGVGKKIAKEMSEEEVVTLKV